MKRSHEFDGYEPLCCGVFGGDPRQDALDALHLRQRRERERREREFPSPPPVYSTADVERALARNTPEQLMEKLTQLGPAVISRSKVGWMVLAGGVTGVGKTLSKAAAVVLLNPLPPKKRHPLDDMR